MSSTVPLWAALVIGLMPSVVAIVAIMAAEGRDRERIEHERDERLREERIGAYRKLLAASSGAEAHRDRVAALSEAYSEISLLAGSDELDRAAAEVWVEYGKAQRIGDKMLKNPPEAGASDFAQALDKARIARERFVRLAHEELGVEGRSSGWRGLEGSTPGEALPDPEAEPRRP